MVDQEDPWSGEALIITDVSSSRVILLSQDNHQDVSTRLYFGVLLRSHSPGIRAERDVNNAAAGDTTVFCYIQKMLVCDFSTRFTLEKCMSSKKKQSCHCCWQEVTLDTCPRVLHQMCYFIMLCLQRSYREPHKV